MTTQEHERQQAEKRLQEGIEAYNAGTLDTAAEVFGDAERCFRILGDVKRVADSCSMLAEVYRQKNQLEQGVVFQADKFAGFQLLIVLDETSL